MRGGRSITPSAHREQHRKLSHWAELWDVDAETLKSWVLAEGYALNAGCRGRTHLRIPDSVARQIYLRRIQSSVPIQGREVTA